MSQTDSSDSEEETRTPHDRAKQELVMATRAHDKPRVRQLFETTPLDADDATEYLPWALPDVAMMRFLLEHGADARSISMRRAYRRSLDVVKLLTEFGFDVKSKGHIILQDCADSREDLDWLLDQGVDASLTDLTREDTGFCLGGNQHDHSLKVLNNIAKKGDIELFDHIVSRGADPLRSMSLHTVSQCRDARKMAAMVDHLLDHYQMDIEANNEDFRVAFFDSGPDSGSPLMLAIYHKNVAAVQKLIDRGAKVTCPGLVTQAIGDWFFSGFLPALGPLLDAGADVDYAFGYAISRNDIEAARMCLERGADSTHTLGKWQRMIKRGARELSDSESEEGHSEAEAEEGDAEREEEDEAKVESRNKMRVFLETISSAKPPTV